MAKKPPMQPIGFDDQGVARFRANDVVQWLWETGQIDLNRIRVERFNKYDVAQFWQMLGYSVSAYGELSFIPKAVVEEADAKVEALIAKEKSR